MSDGPSTDLATREQATRERLLLPVLLPLGLLAVIAVVVGLVSWMLLYNTLGVGLALTCVVAAGVLIAASLASSRDEATGAVKFAAAMVVVVPAAMGLALAGSGGGVDDASQLPINFEPHSILPDIADVPNTLIAAENSIDFTEDFLELTPEAESTEEDPSYVGVVFENRESGVQHNFAIYNNVDEVQSGSPVRGALAATDTITGPDAVDDTVFSLNAGSYYFVCTIHINMNGELVITPVA